MAKLNNRGSSLVELIIAVAVFGVLMVPIVSQLATALNLGQKAKNRQLAVEYCQAVVECIKQSDMDDIGKALTGADSGSFSDVDKTSVVVGAVSSASKTIGTKTYNSMRTYTSSTATVSEYIEDGTKTAMDNGVEVSASNKIINYVDRNYEVSDVKVGRTTYTLNVNVENESLSNDISSPNVVDTGNLAGLNDSVAAIIRGEHVSNYDAEVEAFFIENKLNTLLNQAGDNKNSTPYKKYLQYMHGQNIFANDTVKRYTIVHLSKSGTKYTVSTDLIYVDSSTYATENYIVRNSYKKTFEETLDPFCIYLMYAPCMYNDKYMAADYVVLDVKSSVPTADQINFYMVESDQNNDDIVDSYNQYVLEYNKKAGYTGLPALEAFPDATKLNANAMAIQLKKYNQSVEAYNAALSGGVKKQTAYKELLKQDSYLPETITKRTREQVEVKFNVSNKAKNMTNIKYYFKSVPNLEAAYNILTPSLTESIKANSVNSSWYTVPTTKMFSMDEDTNFKNTYYNVTVTMTPDNGGSPIVINATKGDE